MNKYVKCEFCGKVYSNKGIGTHIWRNHGKGKNHNPNIGYINNTRTVWNKGLTEETSESVKKYAEKNRRIKTELEKELDDDGQLYRKWHRKRQADIHHTKYGFDLTFEQWCYLMKEANIKSSQLGWKGEKYVLARYEDKGAYTLGNCRFITQKENVSEMKNHNWKNKKHK